MSIDDIWRLAQCKLESECMKHDYKLLVVVGHANLLFSLAASTHEQKQRFEREFPASDITSAEAECVQSGALYTMSEKPCSNLAPSSAAAMKLTSCGQR